MTDPFYIIYDNEDQAHIRSEQAGAMRGLSYSQNGTENPRAAIVLPTTTETETDDEGEVISSTVVAVDKDILTDEDEVVESLPSDWAYPPEPEALVQPD